MEDLRLLTDEQMRKFITEGYLVLNTDFSDAFHEELLDQLNDVYKNEGNPGNNLLPRVKKLRKVFDHPSIRGALTSVLGPDYLLHAHRHGHYNSSPKPGGWHKDSYWGHSRTRNHHPWWAMIMYFPQDTPVELGPTSVIPGTQWYESRTFDSDDHPLEAKASGSKGTFLLIQYDIWHRATANIKELDRYMLKFEFMRTKAPEQPSWDNREKEWVSPPAGDHSPIYPQELIWRETWNWLSGQIGSLQGSSDMQADSEQVETLLKQLKEENVEQRVAAANELGRLGPAAAVAGAIPALTQALEDAFEPVALNAAYGLATMDEKGVQALLQGLHHDNPSVSLTSAYGLSVAGKPAVQGLIEALNSERTETVNNAAFALGELREEAAEAVPSLIQLSEHPSDLVRRTIIDALSMIGTPKAEIVSTMKRCLSDRDEKVRYMTSLALARLGEHAGEAVPELIQSLDDDNRYVVAHAADALFYIGTDEAKEALIDFLRDSRWCPVTTPQSTF